MNSIKNQLWQTHERIAPFIHHTPVMTSSMLNEISGASLFFKCENFQRMGAFKMRGALNAILQLTPEQKALGVVTHSSGNFAQALALAAKSLGIKAYIVMPNNAPEVKKQAVKGYGGIIVECLPTLKDRESCSENLMKEKGLTFIHPSNDLQVILGQGTAAKELLEEVSGLEMIFTPVGGGGLVAGTLLATKSFDPHISVIGCEPMAADDAYRSLLSGKIENNTTTDTMADGLKTALGDINFPIIKEHISEIIRIEETEIIESMKLIWERMKLVVEPSAAIALAGVLKHKEKLKGKKIGILLSGGNVDLGKLPF